MLVVGLDGATNRVIDPLLAAGLLPSLARIAREGVRGSVRPAGPLLSPRIWTTFATGLPAERHGVLGWGRLGPQGRVRLSSNLDRRVPALWNVAGAAGRRVGVVSWLMTQPPDRVNGVMISDHAVPGITAERLALAEAFVEELGGPSDAEPIAPEVAIAYAWPPEWSARAGEIYRHEGPPLTDVPSPFRRDGPVGRFLDDVYRGDELRLRAALEVEKRVRPDLLMVYLPGIDRASHLLWQGIEAPTDPPADPSVPSPAQRAKEGDQLRAYYRFSDALLGRLLEGFGPDDFVFVVSDHGFEASTEPGSLSGGHSSDRARDGILYARGPGIAPGTTSPVIADVDLLPTFLAALGLPRARDLPGTPGAFLSLPGLEPVPSYADVPVERVETAASDADDEILERLRMLGYVE